MVEYYRKLLFIIFGVLSQLHASNNLEENPEDIVDDKQATLTINGASTCENLTADKIQVNGKTTCENLTADKIQVNGQTTGKNLNCKNIELNGKYDINGLKVAENAAFRGKGHISNAIMNNVEVKSKNTTITDSNIQGNITLKPSTSTSIFSLFSWNNKSSKLNNEPSKLRLSGKTIVCGDVICYGDSEVECSSEAKINGKTTIIKN